MAPALASLRWPSAIKFPGEIPANLHRVTSTYHLLSTFFRSDFAVIVIATIVYSICTFLAITLPAWISFYFREPNQSIETIPAADLGIVDDAFSVADVAYEDAHTIDDADENEASFLPSLANDPSSFGQTIYLEEDDKPPQCSSEQTVYLEKDEKDKKPPQSSSRQMMYLEKDEKPPQKTFCGICLENKDSWLMILNDQCDHSFCYECTTRHIAIKIDEKVKDIPCPAPNCDVELDSNTYRPLIPRDALVKWDELLCMSLIPDSQKLFCPFRDCSALLVNDLNELIRNIKCVVCDRWFCAQCRVPWHTDFTCVEFQKVYAKKGGKTDDIVKELAKKKRWQKCPRCKMYVEKSAGCTHITCRCGYEFCYTCAAKWSGSHVCRLVDERVARNVVGYKKLCCLGAFSLLARRR